MKMPRSGPTICSQWQAAQWKTINLQGSSILTSLLAILQWNQFFNYSHYPFILSLLAGRAAPQLDPERKLSKRPKLSWSQICRLTLRPTAGSPLPLATSDALLSHTPSPEVERAPAHSPKEEKSFQKSMQVIILTKVRIRDLAHTPVHLQPTNLILND